MGKLRRNYGETIEAYGMRCRREQDRRNEFKKEASRRENCQCSKKVRRATALPGEHCNNCGLQI